MVRRRSRHVPSEGQMSFDDIEAVQARVEAVQAAAPPGENRCPACTRIWPPHTHRSGLCEWCQLRVGSLRDPSS